VHEIVTMSSGTGVIRSPHNPIYDASKHAVLGLKQWRETLTSINPIGRLSNPE
jgi:short-subunit dehydrogenase